MGSNTQEFAFRAQWRVSLRQQNFSMLDNTQADETEYVALVEGTTDEYYVSETYVVNRRKKQKAFSGESPRKQV